MIVCDGCPYVCHLMTKSIRETPQVSFPFNLLQRAYKVRSAIEVVEINDEHRKEYRNVEIGALSLRENGVDFSF